MNLRGALALIRSTWASWMQYRSFFFLLAFGWMIPPLVYLFVWSTAAGDKTIGGLTRGGFVAYYLVLIIVNQLTYSQTNWTVGDIIRTGQMSKLLLRPLHPIFDAFSQEIAGKVVYLALDIPVVILLGLILKPDLHPGLMEVAAFIPALLMAWLLRFFWGYALALLAFWATRSYSLLPLQDTLVFLFAGQVAPVALLPGVLQTVAVILPFRYMVGFPVEALTGQLDAVGLARGFAIQAAWLALALILSAITWKQGVKRYAAVGG